MSLNLPVPSSSPILHVNQPIPWDLLLPGSFYYPCCLYDDWVIQTFSMPGRLFVYVDFLLLAHGDANSRREGTIEWLSALDGFRGIRELFPKDLGWISWDQASQAIRKAEMELTGQVSSSTLDPFAFLAGVGESWVLYLGTEAAWTYEALYHPGNFRPDWFACIQPGMGWFDFREDGNPMEHALCAHKRELPPHVIKNSYGDAYPPWDWDSMFPIHKWTRVDGPGSIEMYTSDRKKAMQDLIPIMGR